MNTLARSPHTGPPGFTPAVPRWSARYPDARTDLHVVTCGVQSRDDAAVLASPFMAWQAAALADPAAPASSPSYRHPMPRDHPLTSRLTLASVGPLTLPITQVIGTYSGGALTLFITYETIDATMFITLTTMP